MKRIIAILLALLLAVSSLALAEGRSPLETSDYLAEQARIDEFLIAEGEAGYPFEAPLVVLNPYGNAPLSAVAIFTTEEEIGGSVTAKGKAPEDDISGSFPAAKIHYVPVYGLYSGGVTDVVITLDDGRSTTVQVETEEVPFPGSDIRVQMNDPEAYDHSLLNINSLVIDRCYTGLDSKGDLRWMLTDIVAEGCILLENGRMMLPSSTGYDSASWWSTGMREIDGLGKVYREYTFPGGTHHEIIELPNGNFLAVADTPNDFDSEDYLTEIDPATGEVVWELDLEELIDRTDGGSVNRTEQDWAHINAACYDAENDILIISCRHLDAIVAINKSEKTLAWVLGDPADWQHLDPSLLLTPVGEDFEWQYAQHSVHLLSNGDVMVFDNGSAGRVKSSNADKALANEDNYSRIVIYRVDSENMTVEQLWQFGKELGAKFYSVAMCNVQILDEAEERYFVNYSLTQGQFDDTTENPAFRTRMHLLEGSDVVWELDYALSPTMSGSAYRSNRQDLYATMGGYDVSAEGVWYGDMGPGAPLEGVQADVENAAAMDPAFTLTRLPFGGLRAEGKYMAAADADLGTFALVLANEEGEQFAYDLHYFTSAAEAGTLVMLDSWTALGGLEAGAYDIYLLIDGETMDSGMSLVI